MSEVTTEQTQSSASTTEQAKERLEEGALQIKDKASEAKVRTREQLRAQIDTRSNETGEQMTSTASALRQTAQRLRTEQREPQAKVLEQIAERTERFGRYLTETDGDRMLRDVERIARQPAVARGRSRHRARLPRGPFHEGIEQPPLRGKRGLDERRAFGARSASRLSH